MKYRQKIINQQFGNVLSNVLRCAFAGSNNVFTGRDLNKKEKTLLLDFFATKFSE